MNVCREWRVEGKGKGSFAVTLYALLSTLCAVTAAPAFAQTYYHWTGFGQSNCTAAGAPFLTTSQPWNNLGFNPAVSPPVSGYPSTIPLFPTSYSSQDAEYPGISLADELTYLSSGNSYRAVVDNFDCASGFPFASLQKGSSQYNNTWLTMFSPTTAAKTAITGMGFTYSFGGFYMVHGEADFGSLNADTYEADLVAQVNNMTSDLNAGNGTSGAYPTLLHQFSLWNFCTGACGESNAATPTMADGVTGTTPIGQWQAAHDYPSTFILSPGYQFTSDPSSQIHYDAGGEIGVGSLMGKQASDWLASPNRVLYVTPKSITQSGSTVTIQWWVPVGHLVFDTITLPAAAAGCYGLEWLHDSNGVTCASVALSGTGSPDGGNDITVMTLSGTPGTGGVLASAYTGVPGTQLGSANTSHSNLRDTDSRLAWCAATQCSSIPAQDQHLYDWAVTFKIPASSFPYTFDPFGTGGTGDNTPPTVPTLLGATSVSTTNANFFWVGSTDDVGVTGYNIYRNGALVGTSNITYFTDTGLTPNTKYTYAVSAFDAAGNTSALSASITLTTLKTGTHNTYTLFPTDKPATIYGIIENANCGDTITIAPGAYNVANGNLPMIYIANKACTADAPLVVQAADFNNLPFFDYTGHPLDSGDVPGFDPGYMSDLSRGAWQVVNSTYVVFDGLHIKGTSAINDEAIAGVRFISTDHFTLRRSLLEKDWNGAQGHGTNTLVEYNQFLGNGKPGSDQQHQFYDGGGDNTTLRYNYFNQDGCADCGQNLHSRSWHSFIYGNWFQDASDYEWDMMSPDPAITPADNTMSMQFYGNVVITSPSPGNEGKVFTFFNDGGSPLTANVKMKLDAQWNTFWLRYQAGSGPGNSYNLFQFNNYASPSANALAEIDLHFANNILHFSGNVPNGINQYSLYFLSGANPWSVTGDNNWFDNFAINTCTTPVSTSGGTCYLSNSTMAASPPFVSMATLDLRPATPNNPFGSADTSQSLKSPYQEYEPALGDLAARTSFSDVGALQYFAGPLPPPTSPIIGPPGQNPPPGSNPPTTTVTPTTLNVRIYPNPWRSDKHASHPSMIFDGLLTGTTIKLFTVSGHKVKELHTDGPSIPWDLTNDSGDKVASGIYMYLITDSQGDKVRGKVAVIK